MPVGVLGVCARPSVGFELHSPYRSHKDKEPKIYSIEWFSDFPLYAFLDFILVLVPIALTYQDEIRTLWIIRGISVNIQACFLIPCSMGRK